MVKIIITLLILSTLKDCSQLEKTMQIEKIIFHTSGCFGTCPTYHLQIEDNKQFKLYAETVYKKDAQNFSRDFDSTRMGYCTGVADDSLFKTVNIELKSIGLDTINFNGMEYTDGPQITLIVYYDGKRKFLQSAFPTNKASRLIASLYKICETSKLKKTNEKFTIESEKSGK